MPSLQGQVVAITGASSGIGAATARALSKSGAKLVLGARRLDRLEALAASFQCDGTDALALGLDVGNAENAQTFVDRAVERFGRIDVLVNCAGIELVGLVADADPAAWRQVVDTNLMGVLHCTRAAIPQMLEQGAGDIVNLSSVAGRVQDQPDRSIPRHQTWGSQDARERWWFHRLDSLHSWHSIRCWPVGLQCQQVRCDQFGPHSGLSARSPAHSCECRLPRIG